MRPQRQHALYGGGRHRRMQSSQNQMPAVGCANGRLDGFLIADLAIYEGEREEGVRLLRALIAKLPASADDYADGVTVKRWVTARLREVEAS